MILHLDFETRSDLDLTKVGGYRYARGEYTDCWCASYAIDDGPVKTWVRGEAIPYDLKLALEDPDVTVAAHNAGFEYYILKYVCAPKYGWPEVAPERLDDTAARAAVCAMPRALGDLAEALELDVGKDKKGKALMMRMARPRATKECSNCDGTGVLVKYECRVCKGSGVRYTWWNVDDRIKRLVKYCERDVEVERLIDSLLPPLSIREQTLWLMDLKSNETGIRCDTAFISKAQSLISRTVDSFGGKMSEITDGFVTAHTQNARMLQWVKSQGVSTESLNAANIIQLLSGDLPDNVRRMLEYRQQAGKTSTAKFKAMTLRLGDEEYARDNTMYHGASTGRWSGKGIQLQNLPRPVRSQEAIEDIMTYVKNNEVEEVFNFYELMDEPLTLALADCIRGCFIPSEGNVFRVADFSNIEGRVNAWLAGEAWKLKAFAAYDAGTAPDLYKVTASSIFGVVPDKISKHQRDIGKVAELALGFGGGVGAFGTMASAYNMDMEDYLPVIREGADADIISRAEYNWDSFGARTGADKNAWLASEMVKLAWRQENSNIVTFWKDLEEAAIYAVANPGVVTQVGDIKYQYPENSKWLLCQLPSKRKIYYPYPRLKKNVTPWGVEKSQLTHKWVDSTTRKWCRRSVYGGLLCENVVQSTARDIMAASMLRLEKNGYPITLTVHDEIISDVDPSLGSQEEFNRLMAEAPDWAYGCPVSVAGEEMMMYQK